MTICLFSAAEGVQEDVHPQTLKFKPDADSLAKEGWIIVTNIGLF